VNKTALVLLFIAISLAAESPKIWAEETWGGNFLSRRYRAQICQIADWKCVSNSKQTTPFKQALSHLNSTLSFQMADISNWSLSEHSIVY
jgi:hypothetical protein